MPKDESLKIRLTAEERNAFALAAEVGGLSLSAWIRFHLRAIAAKTLVSAGLPNPFRKKTQTENIPK